MLLRQLFEAEGKTAVLAFGRLNPPTIGHAKLVDQIKSHDGDHYLFLSQTQKPKTDPLDFATKLKFAKQFFPGVNVGHQAVRTPIQALEMLQNLGYTDVIFVAGSDRVEGFQKLFDTYNGQPDKSGNVPFKFNSIRVASAGERDPDADGAEGMSASKMRKAAVEGNLEAFAQGTPDKKLAQTMYDAVRKGMGVKEPVDENAFMDAKDPVVVVNDKQGKYKEKLKLSVAAKKYKFDAKDIKDQFAVQGQVKLDNINLSRPIAGQPQESIEEGDLILDRSSLIDYIREKIVDYINQERDIDKLAQLLKQIAGKDVKLRGKKFTVTSEDLAEACKHGMYYCSTDRKMKCRQGPKKSRG